MKKLLAVLLVVCLAALSLAGCGDSTGSGDGTGTNAPSGDAGSTDGGEGSGDQTSIKLALWDYETVGYDKAIVEAFEAEHPEYKVEVVSSPNADYEQKITTMLTGGDKIDVFYGKSNTAYPTYVQSGFAMALNDLITEKGFDTAPFGTVLEQHYNIDGTLYALPYRTNDWVIFYNKTIFDDAGVAYPTNNMTWEEYREIARQVTSGEGDEKIYGASFVPIGMGFVVPFLVGKDESFDIMTSDFGVLADPIDYYVALQNEDESYEPYATSKAMSQDQTYFYKGTIAMQYNGSWFTQMLVDNADKYDFEWGIAKQPYWDGNEQRGFATSTPVLINAKTDNVDAAWDLLSYITGDQGAAIMAENKMVPSYMSEETMEVYRTATGIDDTSFEALTGNRTYGLGAANVLLANVSSMMNEELELVITGNQTTQQAIENMTSRRQEIIDQNS